MTTAAEIRELASATAKHLVAARVAPSELAAPVATTRRKVAFDAVVVIFSLVYGFVAFLVGLIVAGILGANVSELGPFIVLGGAAVTAASLLVNADGTVGPFKAFREVAVSTGSRSLLTGWQLWEQIVEDFEIYKPSASGHQVLRQLWLDQSGELRSVEMRRGWSVYLGSDLAPTFSTPTRATDEELAMPDYVWVCQDVGTGGADVKRHEWRASGAPAATFTRIRQKLESLAVPSGQ